MTAIVLAFLAAIGPWHVTGADVCQPLRVRVVTQGPAVRVRVVRQGPADVRVRWTDRPPQRSGEWREVTANEDLRIWFVTANEDVRIREVSANAGCETACRR